MLLIVPSRSYPAQDDLDKIENELQQLNCSGIIVVTGRGSTSVRTSERCRVVGTDETDDLLSIAEPALGNRSEVIFGNKDYCRSYGGANNLVLAIAWASGVPVFIKRDLDCALGSSFKAETLTTLKNFNGIAFCADNNVNGDYGDSLPIELLHLVSSYAVPPSPLGKLCQRAPSEKWDNAIVVSSRDSVRAAPYPNLYLPQYDIHLRGEIYYREPHLTASNVFASSIEGLSFSHERDNFCDTEWLVQMLAAGDLVYTYAGDFAGANISTDIKTRNARIAAMCEKIRRGVFGDIVDSEYLIDILKESPIFSDNIISDYKYSLSIWGTLLNILETKTAKNLCDDIIFS